ncbi:hypothetical protein BDV12DRAFT_7563 [Aspergillus spectabilis]
MGKVEYDIREVPLDKRIQAGQRYRKPLYYAAQAATWVFDAYFVVRLGLLIGAAQRTWQMWLMILVEWIFARTPRQNQLLNIATGYNTQSPRKRLRLRGNESLPRVDVLIPCCGEPLDVILDTVRAACTLDYPTSQFRVLLLDDGGSAALKHATQELRSTYSHLSYNTRGAHSGRVFAKSGNLNYALFSLQEDFQPEYCAILDADCLPAPEFLRATLPHLLQNPQAALLTTRQYYYNLPTGDALSQSRIHFYACENADLDTQGIAIDAGSGALFRRQAILDVGGYPTFSFSEDWQLSLVLHGFGYQTLQVEEPLQFGLVPTSLQGHIAQRNRWNIGHAQQLQALFPPMSKSLPRRLQWDIAGNGMGIVLGLVGLFVGYLAVPVLVLSPRVLPLSSEWEGKVQIILALLHVGLSWLYAWLQMASTGFRVSLFSHLENSWLAGAQLYAIVKFYCFSSKPNGSFVTGSSINAWNRSTTLSAYSKVFRDALGNGVIFGICCFLVTVGAMILSIPRLWGMDESYAEDTDARDMVARKMSSLLWPPLLHIIYLASTNLWVPVACLLSPPRWPARATKLVETERGILFPPDEVRRDVLYQELFSPLSSVTSVVVAVLLIGILVTALL